MSFPNGHAVIVGASGGIGAAMLELLLASPDVTAVTALARRPTGRSHAKLRTSHIELTDEASIAAAAAFAGCSAPPRLVVVATGLLHAEDGFGPEKSWRALDAGHLARSFAVNSIGPALVAKHFLPLLPRAGRSVFAALTARVGSIADNRSGGWHGYRSSKAALNMLLRTLSVELALRWPEAVCVGLHPGTVATGLSQPFRSNVPQGKLFSAAESAAHLLGVVARLTPADTGRVFAWDGQPIPF